MISGATPVMLSLVKFTAQPSSLHEELARKIAERLDSGLGDADRLGNRNAPVVEPDARHEVDRHVRLQHRFIDRAERDRALAPVGWIVQSDRIAAARILEEAVPLYGFRP